MQKETCAVATILVVAIAAMLWLGTASAGPPRPLLSAALRSTSTSVSCTAGVTLGQMGSCTAVVSDTDTGTATTPSGTVDFSAGSVVAFPEPAACTLSADSCQITYTGSAPGATTIRAAYGGDSSHTPSSGTQEVSVTGSVGAPTYCKVPRVAGKTFTQAKRTLRHSQCRLGRVTYSTSKRIKSGRVIGQSPRPGKVLPSGAKVGLVLSRGKPA